jgi:hypothetical protein
MIRREGKFKMKYSIRSFSVTAAVALIAALCFAGTAQAEDATIKFSGGSVAAGIGYSWGSGTLTFQGKEHKFKVTGFSVVDIGASSIDAAGTVSDLKSLSDFNGIYTAVSAGGAVAGGGGVITMRNPNGVKITATSTAKGLQFNLAVKGITFTLE